MSIFRTLITNYNQKLLYHTAGLALLILATYYYKTTYTQESTNPRAPIITSFSNSAVAPSPGPVLQIQNQAEYPVNQSPVQMLPVQPQPRFSQAETNQQNTQQNFATHSPTIRPVNYKGLIASVPANQTQQVLSYPRNFSRGEARRWATTQATGLRMLGPSSNPAGTLATSFMPRNQTLVSQPNIIPTAVNSVQPRGAISHLPAGGRGTRGISFR